VRRHSQRARRLRQDPQQEGLLLLKRHDQAWPCTDEWAILSWLLLGRLRDGGTLWAAKVLNPPIPRGLPVDIYSIECGWLALQLALLLLDVVRFS
jgi:hypothetical protein